MKRNNGMHQSVNAKHRFIRFACGLSVGLLSLSSGLTQAAPGSLSQLPLFLTSPVQPNIFFLLDDSGSMDWEVLKTVGALAVYGTGNNSGNLDFDPGTDTTNNLEHCAGYNAMAYDPNTEYTPWHGVDSSSNAFQDQSVTSARVNPYTGSSGGNGCTGDSVDNSNGKVCNLVNGFSDGVSAFYYRYHDWDGDGVYDKGECTEVDTTTTSGTPSDYRAVDRVYVSTLGDAQKTNYANWFSYYRKREYVMKRAVSEIVDESTERMGFATINRNNHVTKNTEVGTQVKDIDDLSQPVNTTAAANKVTLLDNLLGINSSNSTPLRMGLYNTGRYFMNAMTTSALFGYVPSTQSDSASGHSPIVNADLGGTCQQNFAIVMSDGFWNGTTPSVGNTDDGSGDFDGKSYGDDWLNTLADVAMYYYETDLLNIDDEVPVVKIDVSPGDETECNLASTINNPSLHPSCYDTNTAQHLVTYTVSFGVFGTIPEKDTSGTACKPMRGTDLATQNWPSSCDSSLSDGWPEPVADTSTAIDDMNHAAWNGRGEFLSAASPQDLITSLQEAIESISSRNPVAAAAVAVDAANVINGGNVVQAKFDSAYWSGELRSFEITTTSGVVSVSTSPTWEAHDLLDARSYTSRLVVTYNGTQGIPFDFPSDYGSLGTSTLSQAQINDLLQDAPHPLTATGTDKDENQAYGEDLVNYLLGDQSMETSQTNGIFRKRGGHRLGDIVHSAPVYVGDPDATQRTNDSTYQTWANNTTTGAKGRMEMIYIGANDGALHAFKAGTGEEVFAYFPLAVFKDDDRWGLHWLADPAYDHNYYVDGEITVAEVYVDLSGGSTPKWSTILIGTLRGGGRSVFAMDISDPSYFTTEARVAEKILWEFTDDELGYTYGKPTVAKLNDGRWAAIFGNGYNPGSASTGKASLFIKYLDNASPSSRIISTGVGSIANSDCLDSNSNCNGLSTPAVVDLGGDDVADRVYAGDILGNLWAFDLSSSTATAWNVAYSVTPLFTAKSAANAVQPITAQPMVILHPTERHSNTSPNTMIFFGTGQYIAENDPTSTTSNSFYGIWDSGSVISGSRDSVLVGQTVTTNSLAGNDVRLLSNNAVDYTTDRGWYFDLPTSGERVISFPSIIGNVVAYTTIVPDSNVCSTSDGYSWLMVHNLLDGSEPDFIAIDVTGDGIFDSEDQVGDTNVGGVKSGSLYWQMTPAKSGAGSQVTTFIPAEDLDLFNLQGGRSVGTRSSWGRYRME